MTSPYPRGTLSAVARRLRLTLSHVSRVASGERDSAKILAALDREAAKRAAKEPPPLARNVAAT